MMNLKNFMQENLTTAFEIVPDVLILNVIANDTVHGLDVDTTNIQQTTLQTVSEYTLENDILTVSGLSLNTNTVNILGTEEEI